MKLLLSVVIDLKMSFSVNCNRQMCLTCYGSKQKRILENNGISENNAKAEKRFHASKQLKTKETNQKGWNMKIKPTKQVKPSQL